MNHWLERIAATVASIDRVNSAFYENNAQSAIVNLTKMHADFEHRLSQVKAAHYIVYHDAYQHFARSYDLQKPMAIALSDARAPGARKLREMRLRAKQSSCAFSELQHDDIVVDTVTEGLTIKRGILDPMGSTIPTGPNHYPQMMQALVNNFIACLS